MIAVLGAGAFGTALALALPGEVRLWGRGLAPGARYAPRLPDHALPPRIHIASSPEEAIADADVALLAVPMKALAELATQLPTRPMPLIACSKGIDPQTGLGPVATMAQVNASPLGLLTGPSFAADIARGLPTALTLAMAPDHAADRAADVQARLSGRVLRVYRTDDVTGAELGGALKNVLAIASGAVMGAGLGPSAQAALLARGYGELARLAQARGARAETLMGLSGMGDLMLTAYSEQSRNFRYGLALGRGEAFEPGLTVEGVFTAGAVARLAEAHGLSLPVLSATQRLISGELAIKQAVEMLMTRPLREES